MSQHPEPQPKKTTSGDSSVGQEAYIILPGLKVRGISSVTGRAVGLNILTDEAKVVAHLEAVLEADRKLLERFDRVTRQNIHEIRGMNAGIYHAAVELLDNSTDAAHSRRVSELAGNIVALSQILSARIDFVNYQADDALLEVDFDSVPVYKKFDKMVRCFKPRAMNSNGSLIEIKGSSFSSTFGPNNMMELVAYLLLDNALKYSPKGKSIQVEVREDAQNILVKVTSIGPRIYERESDRIFELDYRGELAERTGKGGSGIGLHAVRNLVEDAFLGSIRLERGSHVLNVHGIPFDDVAFVLGFPIEKP